MKTQSKNICAAIALALGLSLASCTTISENPDFARIAVQYATLKAIDGDPVKAVRVAEIAGKLGESSVASATVALIEAAVRAEIKWEKLDAADSVMVDALIVLAREELVKRVGDGLIKPDQEIAVKSIAGWIKAAAEAAIPKTG